MKPKPSNRLLALSLNSFLIVTSITLHATDFNVPAGTTENLSTTLDVGEGLTKTGPGTLVVTTDQLINDDVVLDDGTLIFYGAADPEEANPSFIVNSGTLMLGGNISGVPVSLNGGTLRIGAQRSMTVTSFSNSRGHILGTGDTPGTAPDNFAPYDSRWWYVKARATGNPAAEAVGVPNDGLITSGVDPSIAFNVKTTGSDNSNVNSHQWGNHRPVVISSTDRIKYAKVDILTSTRGNSTSTNPGMAVYTTYTDQATTTYNAVGSTGSIPNNPTISNANTAFSGGRVTQTGEFDTETLMHMYSYTRPVDPTRDLYQMSFLRNGGSGPTNVVFALSGLAVNESSFASDISVTADSVLDLAGAPIVDGSATLAAGALTLNDAALTITRSINNNTAHRSTFTGGVLTGMGVIDVANSPGNGAGTVIVTGALTGSGGLQKIGSGNLGLPATNTYEGVTEIDAGTVFLNNVNGLGSSEAGTTFYGGTLYLLNGSHTAPITEPLSVASTAGTSTLRSGNGFSYELTGPLVLDANLSVTLDADTTITHSGPISGPGTILKTSGETLTLSGDNSFGSGALVLGSGTNNRGYIRLTSNTALGNHSSVNLASSQGGISGLQLEGGVTLSQDVTTQGRQNATTTGYVLRNLSEDNSWNGNITINNSGGGYGILSDSGTLSLGGTISSSFVSNTLGARLVNFAGAGNINVTGAILKGEGDSPSLNLAVTKRGSGTLTLAGNNDYSGNTNLDEGTTILSGSISESAVVTLGSGAGLDLSSHGSDGYAFTAGQTLRGSGTITGNARTSGTVTPGFAVGTLTANGNFVFEAGSTLGTQIDTLGTGQVETAIATGNAMADGDVTVTVSSADLDAPVSIDVPILTDETPNEWAVRIRAALQESATITALFNVGGLDNAITLTRLSGAANDTTLNIALDNSLTSPGITPALTSADTTAGIAPGADLLAISGQLDVAGATLDLTVIGTPNEAAYVIATYDSLSGNFSSVPNLPDGYQIDYAYASGTAIALVEGGPTAGDYASWAAANGVIGGPGGDSDQDGISNLVEYALLLNFNGSDGSVGTFEDNILSFTKRQDAIDNGDVSWIIETSETLEPDSWTPAVTQAAGNTQPSISHTLPAGQGKIFGRLKVVQD